MAVYEPTKCWWELKQCRYDSLEREYRMRKEHKNKLLRISIFNNHVPGNISKREVKE